MNTSTSTSRPDVDLPEFDIARAARETSETNAAMRKAMPQAIIGLTLFTVPIIVKTISVYAVNRGDPPPLPLLESVVGLVLSLALMIGGIILTLPYWKAADRSIQNARRNYRAITQIRQAAAEQQARRPF